MPRYCWAVLKSYDCYGSPEVDFSAVCGPSNNTKSAVEIEAEGIPFQMKDDDGNLVYEGFWVGTYGDESMFAPLDDFGEGMAGCTQIQYKSENEGRSGSWATL